MKDDSQLIWEAYDNSKTNKSSSALIAAQLLRGYLEDEYVHGDGDATLMDMRTDEGEEAAFRLATEIDQSCDWISNVTGDRFALDCADNLRDMIEQMRRAAQRAP